MTRPAIPEAPVAHQLTDPVDADIANPFEGYAPPDPAADIFTGSSPLIREAWRTLAAGFARQTGGDLRALQGDLDRHVEDLGLAFRVTGDEHERPWPLGPMPILVGAQEWAQVSRGLIQRAELLEAIIADLYGDQSLVIEGHLPAAVVSGSSNFARRLSGMRPRKGHYLHVYAVDLARGPSGEWRVLADRVRFPVGIGYAIENRQALSSATGGLLASIGTRPLAGFYDALASGIVASCDNPDPRIALLTPGRFSQSYPEQAHLARHLGFSLVEGRDLAVREGKLFARTIAGLKRIHALWRWIGTRDLDPLSLDNRSQIGVPGLISAVEEGLVLTNWPGAGVVESRAMPAFLPRLARSILGEPLILPNAATWWCGGERERKHVLDRIDELVISSAFRRPIKVLADGHTRAGASLSAQERAQLAEAMAIRPMDYTAQEIVHLSTTPVIADGRIEARGFTLRTYLARDEAGEWKSLDGGFARVSQKGDLRTSLMGLGDISTDVCIIDPVRPPAPEEVITLKAPEIRREQGLLPSQAADNLFWLGRYAERTHQTARIIRILINQAAVIGDELAKPTTANRLANLLWLIDAAPKAKPELGLAKLAEIAIGGEAHTGSVRSLVAKERQIALLLRDRLTRDSWRALQRPIPSFAIGDCETMAGVCDAVIERHAALTWLMSDGMSHGPAWRFLDMGARLERGSMILQATAAMIPGSASANDLTVLLELVDGLSLYRGRYLTMPLIPRVHDMVLLDPAQPRGLAFQIDRLDEHLNAIPPLRDDAMPEPPLRLVRQLRSRVQGLDASDITSVTLTDLRERLSALSEAIARRYFLQVDRPQRRTATRLLA
ncbi:MAG: circularly permuted type 2 ATP-grasp protein [Erythrobacter sp.]|nr:circularly permuted type 2 ATP-grasp protein [Erythrobacter sp.]